MCLHPAAPVGTVCGGQSRSTHAAGLRVYWVQGLLERGGREREGEGAGAEAGCVQASVPGVNGKMCGCEQKQRLESSNFAGGHAMQKYHMLAQHVQADEQHACPRVQGLRV